MLPHLAYSQDSTSILFPDYNFKKALRNNEKKTQVQKNYLHYSKIFCQLTENKGLSQLEL